MEGAKFVTLVHVTGASEGALRDTLAELLARRLVARNPGYGHPLRPEYVLTKRGERLAKRCAAFEHAVDAIGVWDVARLKWPMPVLFATGGLPSRFSRLASRLSGVTDRALSQSLHTLLDVELLSRRLVDDRPPAALYTVSDRGRSLLPALGGLALSPGRR